MSKQGTAVIRAYRAYQVIRTPLAYAVFLEKLAEYRRWRADR